MMDSETNASAVAAIAGMGGFDGHLGGHQKSLGLRLWGNQTTMNMNTMVLTNVQQSPYFKYELVELKTFHEVVDAIYYKVTHLEPWERGTRRTAGLSGASGGGLQVRGVGAGGVVSTAYCLLYKLFTLRINKKQLQTLLDHPDSPYIRGLGFMYIRYCLDPKVYWDWFEPYLDDPEEIDVKAGGGCLITIGEMLRQFLTQLDWYSTLFPRIPVPIEKELRAKLAERFSSAAAARQQSKGPAAPAAPADEVEATARDGGGVERRNRGDNKDRSRSRSRDRQHHRGQQHHHKRRSRSRSRSPPRDREKDRDRDRDRRSGDRGDRDRHRHKHKRHHHKERDRREHR